MAAKTAAQPGSMASLSPELSDRAVDIALALDGVPPDAVADRIVPSFDDSGVIVGAVVRVRFQTVTGSFDFPSFDVMTAGDDVIRVPQVVRYEVAAARTIDIAVDLATESVVWATPNPNAITNTSLISQSKTDTEGRPIPPYARHLEAE